MEIKRKFEYDSVYMNIANDISTLSYAERNKVGAIIVSDNGQLISQGFNGTPSGADNCCEYTDENGNIKTKDEVLHAESNALAKCAKYGTASTDKATLYVSVSPCVNCAKIIIQSGIKRVVYEREYRDMSGVKLLVNNGISVQQIDKNNKLLYAIELSKENNNLIAYKLDINAATEYSNNKTGGLFIDVMKKDEKALNYVTLKSIYGLEDKNVSSFINNIF